MSGGADGRLEVGAPPPEPMDPNHVGAPQLSSSEPRPAARLTPCPLPPAHLPARDLSQGEPVVGRVGKDICLASHLPATSTQPTSQRAF